MNNVTQKDRHGRPGSSLFRVRGAKREFLQIKFDPKGKGSGILPPKQNKSSKQEDFEIGEGNVQLRETGSIKGKSQERSANAEAKPKHQLGIE